jgi:tripeptide aminopeptidase
MSNVVDRFLRYVKIDTQANDKSFTVPSASKELNLAKVLAEELNALKLQDVSLDKNGYVMAALPSNLEKPAPVIGFVAHMDTSPSSPGANVNPQIIRNYDGKDILLNKEQNLFLSPREFPSLNKYIGQDLITSDGTSLLGADDKAGVAEIMAALDWMVNHPEFKHGTIKVGFTPDEEIGRSIDHFDVKKFAADFGYTLDGSELGELEYENFNAATARITIHGKQVHPGTAKNIMKNAILIAMELVSMLPPAERPEYTCGREGFFHLDEFGGTVETANMIYIIRDHDLSKFELKKTILKQAGEYLDTKYGSGTAEVNIIDTYYNMKEKVEPVMHIVETAEKAIRSLGIEPKIGAVRGGTDGARLSYLGLPCPNFFSGGLNYHSRFEYIPIPSMEKAVDVILKIIELYANQ